ncbi:nitrate- and nitrite sensing domain-containing protein [Nocardia yamanashiensis]|uniref:sensor histidine kinase n=1 Tax=Nocardia yamanashiensis TaxID=209247 RepID=UPI001E5731BC|nr:nitrate- and nitrite sensing domain-containing protein [Nocardia yamanashiensis]UGT38686.1 nitrate- and nitrite sensing domain-containing protein [Nocardia yamanashiensis]
MSVRARLLSIVLISSVTLLVIGSGAAIYLVKSAREAKQWAELASSTTSPAILMVSAFEEERRLSMLHLAGDPDAAHLLPAARQRSDEALAAVKAKGDAARELNPNGSAGDIEAYNKLFIMVPTLRNGVDARQAPTDQVFGFFTQVIGTIISASMLAARVAPDAGIGIELGYGVEPLRAAEALSQADTLGAVALTAGELTSAQLLEFGRLVGEFRGEVRYSASVLKDTRLAQLNAITGGAAWQQVTAMQDAVLLRGAVGEDAAETTPKSRSGKAVNRAVTLPISLAEWQEASSQVNAALQKLWEDQSRDAHVIAREQGEAATRDSIIGGAVVALIAALAFLAALVLANQFIGRMRRLRRDTLELADNRMPELINRLGAGENVDAAAEAARLDYGTDELGQVADAFNRAHLAAVSAAAGEARTRAGIKAVFLDIAHRSQVVVHRQLALLDRAEREESNAEQLELLFQLDHLATRARRNAENLIILGGEQPGRRWRSPVPLLEVVRGAITESLDYTRLEPGRIPDVRIASHAVADVIHLLAELTDNATACSPPESPVTVTATIVGRGVAVEVIDQGLGMTDAEFAEHNAALSNPPEFSVAALSGNTRLGLFVVAKLAARHGISVKLVESVYGGVRAVALIPSSLLIGDGVGAQPPAPGSPVTTVLPVVGVASTNGAAHAMGDPFAANGEAWSANEAWSAAGGAAVAGAGDTAWQPSASLPPGAPAPESPTVRIPNGIEWPSPTSEVDVTPVRRFPAPYVPAEDEPFFTPTSDTYPPMPTRFQPDRPASTSVGFSDPVSGAPIRFPDAYPPIWDSHADVPAQDIDIDPALSGPLPNSIPALRAARYAAGMPAPAERPDLPRRQRAAFGDADPAEPEATGAPRLRSAEEARKRMSAISKGSRQGRRPLSDTDSKPTD